MRGSFAPDSRERPDFTGLTILIVEDEALIALDVTMALEDVDATVIHAQNVAEALALVDTQEIHGAVLDVNLDGETCEPVAKAFDDAKIPYVIHSGDLAQRGELITKMKAPIIYKPASTPRIVGRLAELMAKTAPS